MEAKIKQFNVENKSEETVKVTVDLDKMELLKGDVIFKELQNDFTPNYNQKNPVITNNPLFETGKSEERKEKEGDLNLLRLQWYGQYNSLDFKNKIIEYFDSKTDETFKDTNKLIAESLTFMKEVKLGCPYSVIDQITLRNKIGEKMKEVKFNPQNYFSANQFQARILDIALPDQRIIENYKEIGEMDIEIPPLTSVTVTLF